MVELALGRIKEWNNVLKRVVGSLVVE